jgi:hypothetical protein
MRLNKDDYIKKLKELAERPGNIEGIYNYCDRWCERCSFTSKCLNFAMHDAAGFEKDLDNANFWQDLHIIFEATFQMLEEDLKRFDIDIEEVKKEVQQSNDSEDQFEKSERHPLTERAREMGLSIMQWLDEYYKKNEKLEAIGIKPEEKMPNINDAIEVINWYALFISAKINRAISYFYDDFDDETMKSDSDGSAKIAMVAIDRSIEAWTFLYSQLASDEDQILQYLVELSSIRDETEKLFPDARTFVRPGFDEIMQS